MPDTTAEEIINFLLPEADWPARDVLVPRVQAYLDRFADSIREEAREEIEALEEELSLVLSELGALRATGPEEG